MANTEEISRKYFLPHNKYKVGFYLFESKPLEPIGVLVKRRPRSQDANSK
jgi:hypothetical protein